MVHNNSINPVTTNSAIGRFGVVVPKKPIFQKNTGLFYPHVCIFYYNPPPLLPMGNNLRLFKMARKIEQHLLTGKKWQKYQNRELHQVESF